jgi:hypothetical protein
VTNVTRLDFIFVMSDLQNANRSPFSADLPNWLPAGTATRSRGSATQMFRAAEHEALPIHAQWCTSRSSAPISVSM